MGGKLIENPPEGELQWVSIDQAMELPMQDWFKRRFPLFFRSGTTFEMSFVWDSKKKETIHETIRNYGDRK